MRTPILSAFLLASTMCVSQTCSVQYVDSLWASSYFTGMPAALPNGGHAITNSTNYVSGDLLIGRFDANGALLSSTRKMALSPSVWLWEADLRATQDGGLLAFGQRTNLATSWNSYIIKMDSTGATEWARMYLRDFADIVETNDGGLLISAWDDNSSSKLIKTDENGIPTWGMRETATYALFNNVSSLANGDLLVLNVRQDSVSQVRRFDLNGAPVWGVAFNAKLIPWEYEGAVELTNGNLLVWGYGHENNVWSAVLVLLDANGALLNCIRVVDHYVMEALPLATGGFCTAGSIAGPAQQLVEWSPSMVPLSSWDVWPDWTVQGSMGLQDDTMRLALRRMGPYRTAILKATAPLDLSCTMTSGQVPVTTPLAPTAAVLDALVADTIRNWSMALVDVDPNACDVAVGGGSGPLRPGFTNSHHFVVENQGGETSAPLSVTATMDPNIAIQSALPVPNSIVGNTVTWTGASAMAGLATSSFHVLGTLPPDTALLGQFAVSTFSVQQDSLETTLVNNTCTLTRMIGGSYDPNDKLVFPKDFYHITNDSILDYTIRFQNTGTDTAFNIVVVDTLPADLDVMTFEAGAASHPYTYSLTGEGLLKFTFNNILLPDSNTNEPMSHGLVNFRIKPIQPIQLGQTITNVADIYFDFNPPVRTPPATVVVTAITAVQPIMPVSELKLYPVPVRDVLTVEVPEGFLPRNAIITASDGRAVWSSGMAHGRTRLSIPVQGLTAGAYTLTLLSLDGERSQARFVKD